MPRTITLVLAPLLAVASFVAHGGEQDIRLKDGPAAEAVRANCSICHSLDYIQMNSPFMKKAAWQATVNKMVKVMGAPIGSEDIPAIVDYLVKNYGVE